MKKKIGLVLSLCLAMVMMLSACGTDPTTVDYNGVSYDMLKQNSEQTIQAVSGMDDEEIEYYIQNQSYDEAVLKMLSSFKEARSFCGEAIALGEFSVDKTGNTLTTKQIVNCQNRNMEFYIVFNYFDMSITGYTVEPVYTLGEKMSKAGLNTLISMLIVFSVLILISLIISCFKFFSIIENKKNAKAQAAVAAANDQVVTQIEQREQQLVDDTELVAVIAAAIAASTGTSTSDFVVRSINRR